MQQPWFTSMFDVVHVDKDKNYVHNASIKPICIPTVVVELLVWSTTDCVYVVCVALITSVRLAHLSCTTSCPCVSSLFETRSRKHQKLNWQNNINSKIKLSVIIQCFVFSESQGTIQMKNNKNTFQYSYYWHKFFLCPAWDSNQDWQPTGRYRCPCVSSPP